MPESPVAARLLWLVRRLPGLLFGLGLVGAVGFHAVDIARAAPHGARHATTRQSKLPAEVLGVSSTEQGGADFRVDISACAENYFLVPSSSFTLNGVSQSFSIPTDQIYSCGEGMSADITGMVVLHSGDNSFSVTLCDLDNSCSSYSTTLHYTPIAVDSVVVSLDSSTITDMSTTTASATAYDSSGHVMTGLSVTLWSGDSTIATVNEIGTVTGLVPNHTAIFATIGTVTGSAALTVTTSNAVSVKVVPAAPTLTGIGTTMTLTDTVRDEKNFIMTQGVTWSSSNNAVATVNSSGGVTAVAVGVDTIKAAINSSVSGIAVVTVAAPPVPPPTLTIGPPSDTMSASSVGIVVDACVGSSPVPSFTVGGGNVMNAFNPPIVGSGSCPSGQSSYTYIGTVAVSVGANVFMAKICDSYAQCASGSATYTVNAEAVDHLTIAMANTNPAVGGPPDPATATVYGVSGDVLTVWPVTWTSSAPSVATIDPTGVITPLSVGTTNITATADGKTATVSITVQPRPVSAIKVVAHGIGPDSTIVRDRCLTIAAGDAGAYECGDLRVAQPMLSMKTLGTMRTPMLVYNSRAAHATAVVRGNVTISNRTNWPESLEVRVKISGHADYVDTVPWNPSCNNVPCRVARVIGGDADALTTGAYSYILQVKTIKGDSSLTGADTSVVIIVDRRTTPYGKGWWVNGFEQIFTVGVDSTHLLWVGGDGSARIYTKRRDSLWTAPNIDHPDSLIEAVSADSVTPVFRRLLPQKAYVEFSWGFFHIKTVDRLGHATLFQGGAVAPGGLSAIIVASPDSMEGEALYTYYFSYQFVRSRFVWYVDTVSQFQPMFSIAHKVAVQHDTTSGALTGFTDPDSGQVNLLYGANSLTRINRLKDTTYYLFDAGGSLKQTRIPVAKGSSTVLTHTYCAAETATLNDCMPQILPSDSVSTLVIGARTDLVDSTRFFVNALGAPTSIQDALGHTTSIFYDLLWRGLGAEMVDPRGHVITATYDARGNLLTRVDNNPYSNAGDTRQATTTYTYSPGTDFLTQVVSPIGDTTTFTVDTMGNRLTQMDARGASSLVRFAYDVGYTNLLASVTAPNGAEDLITYGGDWGNVGSTRTPLGFLTRVYSDIEGRDTSVVTPLDSAQTVFTTTSTYYDVMSRVTKAITAGPRVTRDGSNLPVYDTTAFDSVVVTNHYDAEGRLLSLKRHISPNPNGLNDLTTQWTYDALGRKTSETAPDGHTETYIYGDGENVTQTINRRGDTVTTTYDALNRLTQRTLSSTTWPDTLLGTKIVPADVEQFTYDAAGNMLTANNHAALVTRTYNLNGTLASETQAVADSAGFFNGSHNYLIGYHYDKNARRDSLYYPGQLASVLPDGVQNLAYHYTNFGALDSVSEHMFAQNSAFVYSYDNNTRLTGLQYPNGVREVRQYDLDDRLTLLAQLAPDTIAKLGWPQVGFFGTDTIQGAHLSYEARASILAASAMDFTVTNNGYDGLGHLRWQFSQGPTGPGRTEQYALDPMGNLDSTATSVSGTEIPDGVHHYDPGTARLLSITPAQVGQPEPLLAQYDMAGNQTHTKKARWAQPLNAPYAAPPSVPLFSETQYAYDALGRLRFVIDRWDPNGAVLYPAEEWTDEETRYDALGRRVFVAANHMPTGMPTCNPECTVTHFVWDGQQVLGEFRQPDSLQDQDLAVVTAQACDSLCLVVGGGMHTVYSWLYGQVAYVHGQGLDQPLAVYRSGGGADTLLNNQLAMYPHANWTGNLTAVSFTGGQGSLNGANTPPLPSQLNGTLTAYGVQTHGGREVLSWMGSLVAGQVNETGLAYKRNRYYDPASGKFTQEDPIGLAGGMNEYGYANGDPVNGRDPFGLLGCDWGNTSDCEFLTLKGTVGTFGMGYDLGKLGGVSVEASPLGKVTSTVTIGAKGISAPETEVTAGFEYSASAKVGPGEVTGKVEGKANFGTGQMDVKASLSAGIKNAVIGSDGIGIKFPGGSVKLMPHMRDIFIAATESIYEWAKPALDIATGHP